MVFCSPPDIVYVVTVTVILAISYQVVTLVKFAQKKIKNKNLESGTCRSSAASAPEMIVIICNISIISYRSFFLTSQPECHRQ